MGYYTNYTIEVKTIDDHTMVSSEQMNSIAELVRTTSGYQSFHAMGNFITGDDAIKWYKWLAHITEISQTYPQLVFVVRGAGEEHGDNWIAFLENGVGVTGNATLVFPTKEQCIPIR